MLGQEMDEEKDAKCEKSVKVAQKTGRMWVKLSQKLFRCR